MTGISPDSLLGNGASRIELAVHLFSKEAIGLYEKFGFNPRALRMEKELDEKKKRE